MKYISECLLVAEYLVDSISVIVEIHTDGPLGSSLVTSAMCRLIEIDKYRGSAVEFKKIHLQICADGRISYSYNNNAGHFIESIECLI